MSDPAGDDDFEERTPPHGARQLHTIPLFDPADYPGHGHWSKRASDTLRPLSPWGRLCRGQGMGKKANLRYFATARTEQPSPVDILQVQGDDGDAVPIHLTLAAPAAIFRSIDDIDDAELNIQNMTGEFDNLNSGGRNYPGTGGPIVWPPFVAIVEWGVGGTRAKAYVDFMNGTTINLGPCSFVRVRAEVPADAINAPGTDGVYTLAGFVGPGHAKANIAQRTIYLGNVDQDLESNIFATPLLAKRMSIIATQLVGAPQITAAYLRFWRDPGGNDPIGDYFVNGNQPLPFDVPNGGMYFSIVSGMASTARFLAVAELAI